MTQRHKKLSELTNEDVDRMVAQKEAEAEAEKKARHERMEKTDARLAWLAEGGDEASFERQWPSLRDEARRRRVMERSEQAAFAARSQLRRSL